MPKVDSVMYSPNIPPAPVVPPVALPRVPRAIIEQQRVRIRPVHFMMGGRLHRFPLPFVLQGIGGALRLAGHLFNHRTIGERLEGWIQMGMSDREITGRLQTFIAQGGNVREIAVGGRNASTIRFAVSKGRIALAEALVNDFECRIEEADQGRIGVLTTILYSHNRFNKVDALRRMIALGAALDQRSDLECTPFMLLVLMRREGLALPFLERQRAHLNHVDRWANTVLHYAVKWASLPFFADLLLIQELRELINHKNQKGYTPLQESIEAGDLEKVNLLLRAGADQTILGPNGETLIDLVNQSAATPEKKVQMLERLMQER